MKDATPEQTAQVMAMADAIIAEISNEFIEVRGARYLSEDHVRAAIAGVAFACMATLDEQLDKFEESFTSDLKDLGRDFNTLI